MMQKLKVFTADNPQVAALSNPCAFRLFEWKVQLRDNTAYFYGVASLWKVKNLRG